MIKGYIFDLDGVIVDTAKHHFASWRRLANTLGFDITEEQNENLKGVSRKESLEYILEIGGKKLSTREKKKLAAVKNSWYVKSISSMDESELLPGAKALIVELHSKGLKIALGSASKNSIPILKATGLFQYFNIIIDGNKTTESKPSPQVFLMGAEGLGLKAEECIVFEDSINGIKAANQGNFMSIGVGSAEVLHEANHVISSLENTTIDSLNKLISGL